MAAYEGEDTGLRRLTPSYSQHLATLIEYDINTIASSRKSKRRAAIETGLSKLNSFPGLEEDISSTSIGIEVGNSAGFDSSIAHGNMTPRSQCPGYAKLCKSRVSSMSL